MKISEDLAQKLEEGAFFIRAETLFPRQQKPRCGSELIAALESPKADGKQGTEVHEASREEGSESRKRGGEEPSCAELQAHIASGRGVIIQVIPKRDSATSLTDSTKEGGAGGDTYSLRHSSEELLFSPRRTARGSPSNSFSSQPAQNPQTAIQLVPSMSHPDLSLASFLLTVDLDHQEMCTIDLFLDELIGGTCDDNTNNSNVAFHLKANSRFGISPIVSCPANSPPLSPQVKVTILSISAGMR